MQKTRLRKYARLLVTVGINLQPGQEVRIDAAVDQGDFVKLVTEEAYRAGASKVTVEWAFQDLVLLHYRYQTAEQLCTIPQWQEEKMKEQAEKLPCRIVLVSEDPDGLKGLDQRKMQKAAAARHKRMEKYIDAMENKYQWVIGAVPSKAWAKKVFPEETGAKAVEKLWELILNSVYVGKENDPVKAWEKHNEEFRERADWLNQNDFDYLEYKDKNGTDFKVWLNSQVVWAGGGEETQSGIYFNPNMPTEEIFTTPLAGKCEGTLVASKPLSYQGQLIENFSITFENGRAVSCKAEKGEEVLRTMLAMDEGASMLGEVALVPHDSPISRSGVMFYETLFDENASCHVAMGRGFSNLLKGYEEMTKEEWTEHGINDSMIHVDFMIGTKHMEITGTRRNGEKVPVFSKGNWCL